MMDAVLLSGGLDSTVLLAERAANGGVLAITIDYGQRHRKEVTAAGEIALLFGAEHVVVKLTHFGSLLKGSSQTDRKVPVPEGHYAAANMKTTVVPNRNMVMLAVAASIAETKAIDRLYFAAHGGDHAIYPDCRPAFVEALRGALLLASWRPVGLVAPFLGMTKGEIVRRGAALSVPFARTWSCYKGLVHHCGRCGTCVERREAFAVAGVPDPTTYL